MAKTLGISPNYEGLRIVSGNNSYFFPPSSFAEAVIGVASEHEIREMLDSVTIDSVLNKVPFELPYLEAFLSSQNGEDPWSELEEAVMRHHEGVKNLLRIESVRGESTSPLKVSRATVKRRGSAVHERDRHTNIRGYKFIGASLRLNLIFHATAVLSDFRQPRRNIERMIQRVHILPATTLQAIYIIFLPARMAFFFLLISEMILN